MESAVNEQVRKQLYRHKVTYRELGEVLHLSPSTICRLLKKELTDVRRREFLDGIQEAVENRG